MILANVSGSLPGSRPVVKSRTAVMGSYHAGGRPGRGLGTRGPSSRDVYFCVGVGAFELKSNTAIKDLADFYCVLRESIEAPEGSAIGLQLRFAISF